MMANFMIRSSVPALVAMLMIFNNAYSWGRFGGHHSFNGDPEARAAKIVEKMTEDLTLDTVQQQTLQEMKQELLEKHKLLKPDRELIFDKLMAETGKETFDKAVFYLMIDEQTAKMKLESGFFAEKLVQFHQMLRYDQREIVKDHLLNIKTRHEERKNGWFYKTPDERADQILGMVSDRLELTEEQFEQFKVIRTSLMAARQQYMNEDFMMSVGQQLTDLFAQESVEVVTIQNTMNKMISRMENMLKKVVDNYAAAHAVLTIEQRQMIVEQMQKHHQHRAKR